MSLYVVPATYDDDLLNNKYSTLPVSSVTDGYTESNT